MADKKISQLTGASTPLAGTEVLPIVQSGSTVKVASDDLTVKNVRSNATSGILQVAGPAAASTRVMTTPDANFTAARTDAAQTFTGNQTFSTVLGTTFDTNVAAAGVTLSGTTLEADGTDSNIDVFVKAKAAGSLDLRYGVGSNIKVGKTSSFTGAETAQIVFHEGSTQLAQLKWDPNGNTYVIENKTFNAPISFRTYNGVERMKVNGVTGDVEVVTSNLTVGNTGLTVGSAATAGGLVRTDGFSKVFTAATANIFTLRFYAQGAAFVDVAVGGIIAAVGGQRQVARYAINQVNGGTATVTNISSTGDGLISTSVADSGDYSTVTFIVAGNASNQATYQIMVSVMGISADGSGGYDTVVYTRS